MEPAKFLQFFWYTHLHAIFTFSNVGVITYYHSKLFGNPEVTSGGYPPNHNILSFEAVGNPSGTSDSFIIPHPILTPLSLSPSCRRPVPLQERPRCISIATEDYDSRNGNRPRHASNKGLLAAARCSGPAGAPRRAAPLPTRQGRALLTLMPPTSLPSFVLPFTSHFTHPAGRPFKAYTPLHRRGRRGAD